MTNPFKDSNEEKFSEKILKADPSYITLPGKWDQEARRNFKRLIFTHLKL
jgi:hypothetical protein